MTQRHVNAVKELWDAMTRQRRAHLGGTDRLLCVDFISQARRVTRRSAGRVIPLQEFHRAQASACESHLLTSQPFNGNIPAIFPGKLNPGLNS
jgi:hypothetical protein